MYTDAMVAATRRQSDTEITHKIKALCEHGNIHHLHQWETTEQQAREKIATYRLSPESDA